MSSHMSGYGLWRLALVNSAIFILFAFSFFKPRTKRDWRSFGAFSAFIVALFAEMYGFLLAILLFQWPALLTLAMFPVLVWMYVRLARSEEAETHERFPREFEQYRAKVPASFPRISAAPV
jgi:protein-S-isoprenylcysteine O-methyltransferase Ste14